MDLFSDRTEVSYFLFYILPSFFTFDGLGMLVEQGAASFKLYTGLDMPVAEVCDAIYR